MAKKCGQCGAPAVDAQSLFCNLCGGYIQDETDSQLPVCRACGIPAPDDQSVFCTRCGLKFAAEPADPYPVCTSCGSVVPDECAVFCNRCGTKISPGRTPAAQTTLHSDTVQIFSDTPATGEPEPAENVTRKAPGSVIITKKRHSVRHPAKDRAGAPYNSPKDPLPDFTGLSQYPQEGGKYPRLPIVEDETSANTLPSKKYAHIPLIADELKVKDSSQGGFLSDGAREPPSPRQKKQVPKNGILGIFRR
jgi:hypothetical protein